MARRSRRSTGGGGVYMGTVADWRRRSTDTPHPSKVTYTQIAALRTLVDIFPDVNLSIPEAAFLLKWSSNNIVLALLNMEKREIITNEQLVFLNNAYKKQMNNDNVNDGQDGDIISSGGNNMYIESEVENNDNVNDGQDGDNISSGGNMNIELEVGNNDNVNDGQDGDNISSGGNMNIELEGEKGEEDNSINSDQDGDNISSGGNMNIELEGEKGEEENSINSEGKENSIQADDEDDTVRIMITGFNAQAEHMSVSIELLSESHDPLVFSHSVILLLSFTIK